MRAVIQRVSQAQVHTAGRQISQIGKGLLVYVGIGKSDTQKDVQFMAEKIPSENG